MGKLKRLYIAVIACLALLLGACSGGSKFEIDGQLLNMNQGTIYVYSPTGLMQQVDTIQIAAGRFLYTRAITGHGVLVLVFPNFSEVPVFAEPGEDVTLKGNAQQLKKLTITGTDDNELMTEFRLETADQTPPKVLAHAEKFIRENPESPVAVWLLERHFLNVHNADIKKSLALAKVIREKQQDNGQLAMMILKLENLKTPKVGSKLPKFSVKDINDKTLNNSTLEGKKTVIYVAADWDYNGEIDRNIRMLMDNQKYNFRAVKINLNASKAEAKRTASYYTERADMHIVCDEKMFNSPLLKKFGLSRLEDNIILDANGKVIAVNLLPSQIADKLK